MSTRSQWLDWRPKTADEADKPRNIETDAQGEPKKPKEPTQEPGFLGFLGSPVEGSPIFRPELHPRMDEAEYVTWAEWKAAALNRLFLEQGVLGQPAKILPETVRHGERGRK